MAFMTPFAFTLYNRITPPSGVYMSVLADIPMGMIFGGAMCLYFALKDKKQGIGAVCGGMAEHIHGAKLHEVREARVAVLNV